MVLVLAIRVSLRAPDGTSCARISCRGRLPRPALHLYAVARRGFKTRRLGRTPNFRVCSPSREVHFPSANRRAESAELNPRSVSLRDVGPRTSVAFSRAARSPSSLSAGRSGHTDRLADCRAVREEPLAAALASVLHFVGALPGQTRNAQAKTFG